ncbi:MAG: GGDEF domain-containing protein, partial [Actinomycetota bacterium]|nr:GGDEF domain-containing protein [Actinomycetota bacterium]
MAIVAILGFKYTGDATRRADRAAEIVATAEIVGDRVRLRSAVGSEQRWVFVVGKLADLSVSPDLVASAIGLDPWSAAELAASEADELIDRLGAGDIAVELRQLRESGGDLTLDAMSERYLAVVDQLSALIERDLGLVEGASSVERAGTLADAAARLQHARGQQLSGWMGVTAGVVGGAGDPALLLIDSTAKADLLASRVEQLLIPGSTAAAAWAGEEALQALAVMDDIYGATVTALVAGEIAGDASSEIDLVALLAQLDVFVAMSDLAVVSEPYNLEIVEAAILDLSYEAAAQRATATTSRSWVLALAVAALVAMTLLMVALTRLIINPMAQVAKVAAGMQGGSLDQRASVAGLRETRLAATALNGAVAQMKLAERQALALAEERLDDDVLDESVPGLLGASLRRAVGHLRNRLTEQDGLQRRLEHDAAHDSLTALPNRRATMRHLDRALARARRGKHNIAVLFVDIDFF